MNRRLFFSQLAGSVPAPVLEAVARESEGMDRRAFLRFLGMSAAIGTAVSVAGIDPERFLWTPGSAFMGVDYGYRDASAVLVTSRSGHSFVTVDWITRDCVKGLQNNLAFMKTINLDFEYDERFRSGQEVQLLTEVKVRLPVRYIHPEKVGILTDREFVRVTDKRRVRA